MLTPTPLRVHRPPVVDLVAAEVAAAAFLTALGVSLESESRRATPGRMARAYAEMFTPRPSEATTFPNDEGYDELVLARSLPVRSVCQHHLLPFVGVAHVGYLTVRGVGVGAAGASTTTSALHGTLRDDARSRAEFFALVDRPNRTQE